MTIDNGAVLYYNGSGVGSSVQAVNSLGQLPSSPATAGTRLRGTGSVGSATAYDLTGNANVQIWPGTSEVVSQLTSNETLTCSSATLANIGKLTLVVNSAAGFAQKLVTTGTGFPFQIDSSTILSIAASSQSTAKGPFVIVDTAAVTPTLGINTAFVPSLIFAGGLTYGVDYDLIYRDTVSQPQVADIVSPTNGTLATPRSQILISFKATSVTPVKIDALEARAQGAGVRVAWTAVSEFKNAGFNILRRDVNAPSEWVKVNDALIAGRITNPDEKKYAFYDWAPAGQYEYKLEAVGVLDDREFFYPATGPVTVDWNALAAGSEKVEPSTLDAVLNTAALDASVLSAGTISDGFATLDVESPAVSVRAIGRDGTPEGTANPAANQVLAPALMPFNNPRSHLLPAAGSRAADPSSTAAAAQLTVAARFFTSANSSAATSYVAAKVLYSNPGVLLIPQSTLPAGFDINHVSLQREGRSLTPLALTPAGLLVYAQGYQDDYTDKDAIFLRRIAGATQAGMPATAAGLFSSSMTPNVTSPATVTTDYHDVYFDFSMRPYTYAPWFSSQYLTGGTAQDFTLNTPSATSGPASLTVNLWSLTETDGVGPDHGLQLVINGQLVGQVQWQGGNKMMQLTFLVPQGVLNDGANTVTLATPGIDGVYTQIAFLHSMTAAYTQLLDGSSPVQIVNNSASAQMYELNNVPAPGAWVVDTSLPDRAALVPTQTLSQADGTLRLRFMADSSSYLVVPVGQENLPLEVSKRQVKPVKLAGSYMATGPSQFSAGVQPLLAQRNKEGIRGTFVDQEQIFDYYNYGRYGPGGIQNAVRALRPQYLLLLGRTTYDYLNYSGANVDPLCPTFLVSTTFWAQATSDSMFGDLGRGYPEVAVGRLPVNDTTELAGAVQHILSNTGAPASGVRVHAVADRTDPTTADFGAQADTLVQNNPEFTWQKNYLGTTYQTSAEVTASLLSAVNGGADWMVYVGHGNSVRLGKDDPRILQTDSVRDNVQYMTGNSVFLQSTCTANWMAADQTGFRSIAIQALTQPQGGISASIASSTYMNSDNAVAFMNQLLQNANRNGMRWGNALMQTQQWAMAQSGGAAGYYADLSNTEQIFGDPAMPIFSRSSAAVQPPAQTAPSSPATGQSGAPAQTSPAQGSAPAQNGTSTQQNAATPGNF